MATSSSDPGTEAIDVQWESIPIFARLPVEAREALARSVGRQTFAADECIVTQGEAGDLFYVIASGECHVFVSDAETSGSHGALVATLHEGDSFGELALLNPYSVRVGTVITTLPTHVLTISRAAYEQTMRAQHEEGLAERVRFLSANSLFEGWADDALRKLALVITEKTVPPDTTIVEQGSSSHAIYFRRSGTCKVVKRFSAAEAATAAGAPSDGTPLTLCELRTPSYFGELGVLLASGHTASVISCGVVELYLLSKFDWRRQVAEATRSEMVARMLEHAEARYAFASTTLHRSLSIGARWRGSGRRLHPALCLRTADCDRPSPLPPLPPPTRSPR